MRFITITSGKGGVGKSTIAANIAYMLSQYGYKVALFDADVGLANQDIILDVKPKYTILDVLKGGVKFEDIVVQVNLNFLLIPGENGDEILSYKNSEILETFFEGIEHIRGLDYLIIDTGAGIGESVRSFIEASTDTIIITVPDPSAIMDAYSMIKYTSRSKEEIFLIVNRAKSLKEATEVTLKLQAVAKKYVGDIKLKFLGHIEKNELFELCSKKRQLLTKKYPSSIPATQIADIVKKLTNSLTKDGEHIKDTPSIAVFFRRLLQQL